MLFCQETLSAANAGAYADVRIVSISIYSILNEEVLKGLPSLEFIATRSAGFDHIALDYCRNRGIKVSNVPAYGACTVAEHVFGLILTISHRLSDAVDRTRRGDFSIQGLQGFDLNGKTLGVVGTGNIGQCVIRIARGFGMEVLAFDMRPRQDLASLLGFTYTGMEELLERSDIITLHVPSNEGTKDFLNRERFRMMKRGVVVINTSRGPVLKPCRPCWKPLAEGRVAAAGLDVLPEEPVIREEAELVKTIFQRQHNLQDLLIDQVPLRMRNVYVTPHSAFYTREALLAIVDTTVENIRAFLRGTPVNLV